MFNKVVILGLGGIGALVATMLRELGADVLAVDLRDDAEPPEGIRYETADLSDPLRLRTVMAGHDAVICCLPFYLTLAAAEAAHDVGLHYFDATEDVSTTKAIRELAADARHVMIPQNGLAPGFICILGAAVARRFDADELRHIRLRVGALPQHPIGQLGYAGNWSLQGLVHEYIADCEAIVDGRLRLIPPLRNSEIIRIFGAEYEAFSTSGGLGTMTDTFAGRVENLNYKSIRYPGHLDCMRLLLEELRFRNDPDALVERLADALPPDDQDRVLIHASVQGLMDGQLRTQEIVADYWPVEFAGRLRTAITWTTSAAIVALVEMVADGLLPQRGFVRQEDVPLEDFLQTSTGRLYAEDHPMLTDWQESE